MSNNLVYSALTATLIAVASPALATTPVADEPATSTAPSSTNAAGDASASVTPPATPDPKVGDPVYDPAGNSVGAIETAENGVAVIATGKAKARIPYSSFATGPNGLVIALSKTELELAAAGKTPR